jgi:predicted transcriptional regulator
MAVMSIRIKDEQRRQLKAIASLEGRTMTEVVSELVGEYINIQKVELNRHGRSAELRAMMKLSEPSFDEWQNSEDDVYDRL